MSDDSQPLTAERWQRIESLFHAAIELPARERAEFVRSSCAGDDLLAGEVQAIVDGFAASGTAPAAAKPRIDSSRAGELLGEYRIDRELAHGGMGTVFLAHRADGQFEQNVALKVVSPHLRNEFFSERFRYERQILAHLNHPNITRLLDGGVSDAGEPYLAMEYVEGEPIHHYADARALTILERIAIFRPVCHAVEYAHRNLVVHRDLKPGNIFVTAEGVPKLLDFGTAKLLAPTADDPATTRFGMMTPRYASPEQMRGEPVTTATDVYSLGIVLYELLTGAWPFGDSGSPIAGLERAIRQIDPARPASVVTPGAASARRETPAKLARILEGDLASILAKACAWEARDRYGSAEQFAEDLRRYQEGATVLARPQTVLYRATRFARRNRWRLAIAAAVCSVLAAAGLYALGQYARSQRRLVQVRNLSESYLTDILDEVGKLPGSLHARMLIVDRARRNLDELLPDAPRDSELRRALAGAYLKLGDVQGRAYDVSIGDSTGALESYRKAEALAAAGSPKDWELLAILVQTRLNISVIETRSGHAPAAVAILESTLQPAARLLREAPASLRFNGMPAAELAVETNLKLGYAMLVGSSAAPSLERTMADIAQLRRTVAMAEEFQKSHPGSRDLAAAASQYLGFTLEDAGSRTGDIDYMRQSAAAHRRSVEGACRMSAGDPSPATKRNCADALGELSWALHNAGDGEGAVRSARESLAGMRPIANAEPLSAEAQQDLTNAYFHLGAAEEAAGRYQDAIHDLRIAESRIRPRQIVPGDLLETGKLYVDIERILARALAATHDSAGAVRALQDALAAAEGRARVDDNTRDKVRRELADARSAAHR